MTPIDRDQTRHAPVETFVFIESNTTGTGRICLEKAQLRGLRVLFLTQRQHLYGFLREDMIEPVVTDTSDPDRLEALIAAEPGVVGVFSTSEYFIETAATVARRLALPGSDPQAIALCRDKGRLYDCLRAADIAAAETWIVRDVDALRDIAPGLRYPLVAKPATGSGSVDVRLVRDETELFGHGDAVLGATRNERGLAVTPTLLLQRYIEGPEFSVEVVGLGAGRGYRVLAVTGKHLGALPNFVEIGHDVPAPVEASLRERIAAEAIRGLEATGHRFGPAHVECRVSDGRVFIIEINPRLAGGMIPQAVERATGIDVLGAMVDLYRGREPDLVPRRADAASIRFVVPPHDGTLQALRCDVPAPDADVSIDFIALKPAGHRIALKGDFQDRVGLILASGPDRAALDRALDVACAAVEITVVVDDGAAGPAAGGRLRSALHPQAMAIVRRHEGADARREDLEAYAAIDEAHLLMLEATDICAPDAAFAALRHVAALREAGFPGLIDAVAPRGTYALYEQALIARAGVAVGGAVHTARSRNDINACVTKLKLRARYAGCHRALWRLRATLLDKAAATLDWPLPVYSQYQAAQPGSFGYYLWSVDAALVRDQSALHQLEDDLATCPMGAGAGAGTDFPINPGSVAEMLGFRRSTISALDAVASRDLALRLLATLAIAATTLSRLAQDLQLWTMRETAFLELPDALSGGSSLMPQKKNPYLIEIAKGRLAQVVGAAATATAAMQRTPFGNSVEIGTEALSGCDDATGAFEDACDLLRLMIDGVAGDPSRMREAAEAGVVVAAQAANRLVRDAGLNFHEAHRRVGGAIADAVADGRDPGEAVAALSGGERIDIVDAATALRHGGGPGATAHGLGRARERLREDGQRLWRLRAGWRAAEDARHARVAEAIASCPAPCGAGDA